MDQDPNESFYYFAPDFLKYFVAYSERELTFEVNLPTHLGELTFKNMSKWVIDHSDVAPLGSILAVNFPFVTTSGEVSRGATMLKSAHSRLSPGRTSPNVL